MPRSDLYELHRNIQTGDIPGGWYGTNQDSGMWSDDGVFEFVFIPVKRCAHDNTGRHIIEDSVKAALLVPNPADAIAWCSGLGGDV